MDLVPVGGSAVWPQETPVNSAQQKAAEGISRAAQIRTPPPDRMSEEDQNKHMQFRTPTPSSVSSKQEQTYRHLQKHYIH